MRGGQECWSVRVCEFGLFVFFRLLQLESIILAPKVCDNKVSPTEIAVNMAEPLLQ